MLLWVAATSTWPRALRFPKTVLVLVLALVEPSNLDVETSSGLNGRLAYLASIRQPGSRSHICSVILVPKDDVLRTAHCVNETSVHAVGRKSILHIGPAHVDDIGKEVEVTLVRVSYIHPKWDYTQKSPYNVALLQLEKPSSKPHQTLLSDQLVIRTGQHLQTGGWGSGGEDIRVGSNVFGSLKLEEQEFIQQDHCNRLTLWNGTVSDGIVYALNNKQKASCQVGSGDLPFLLDQPHNDLNKGLPRLDFIVGINVDGAPCGVLNKPNLFIRLGHIHNWIAQYIPDENPVAFETSINPLVCP